MKHTHTVLIYRGKRLIAVTPVKSRVTANALRRTHQAAGHRVVIERGCLCHP